MVTHRSRSFAPRALRTLLSTLSTLPVVVACGGEPGEDETSSDETGGSSGGDGDAAEGSGGAEATGGAQGSGGTVEEPQNGIPAGYTGTPYADSMVPGGPQVIPGRVQAEFYDLGGPGVAYLDHDEANNGSGNLNPANGTYLHEFRMSEAVDTSFTKGGDVDVHAYNLVEPELDSLYVGWTGVGEWINLTVNVQTTGTYSVALMYSCNGPGAISLDLNGAPLTEDLLLVNTNDPADPVDWRQFHHWNKQDLGSVQLPAGTHLLTVHITQNGNMNLDYFEFGLAP